MFAFAKKMRTRMIHDTEEDEASGRRKHCIVVVVVVQGRHRSRKERCSVARKGTKVPF